MWSDTSGQHSCPLCGVLLLNLLGEQVFADISFIPTCGHRFCTGCLASAIVSDVPRTPVCFVPGCTGSAKEFDRSTLNLRGRQDQARVNTERVVYSKEQDPIHWKISEKLRSFSENLSASTKNQIGILLLIPGSDAVKQRFSVVLEKGVMPGREGMKAVKQLAAKFYQLFVKPDSEKMECCGGREKKVLTTGDLLAEAVKAPNFTQIFLHFFMGASKDIPKTVKDIGQSRSDTRPILVTFIASQIIQGTLAPKTVNVVKTFIAQAAQMRSSYQLSRLFLDLGLGAGTSLVLSNCQSGLVNDTSPQPHPDPRTFWPTMWAFARRPGTTRRAFMPHTLLSSKKSRSLVFTCAIVGVHRTGLVSWGPTIFL